MGKSIFGFTCPVCGETKRIEPPPKLNPYWVYKDRVGNEVCSYRCYLKSLANTDVKFEEV